MGGLGQRREVHFPGLEPVRPATFPPVCEETSHVPGHRPLAIVISALRVCFQEGMFSGRLQSFEVL